MVEFGVADDAAWRDRLRRPAARSLREGELRRLERRDRSPLLSFATQRLGAGADEALGEDVGAWLACCCDGWLGGPGRSLERSLWNYSREGFLPHGSKKDGYPGRQPVWLTDQDENPNPATVLFLVDGVDLAKISEFDLCCEMFDGRDDDAVAVAREHWKLRKDTGFALTYWQQTEQGALGRKKPKAPPNRTSHGLVRNSRPMHRGNAYIRVNKGSIRVKKIEII